MNELLKEAEEEPQGDLGEEHSGLASEHRQQSGRNRAALRGKLFIAFLSNFLQGSCRPLPTSLTGKPWV